MGQTIEKLSSRKVEGDTVFNNRFVVEICEKVHVHYRNLRIILSLQDFLEMAKGMRDSLARWTSMNRPEPTSGTHIELCRKKVAEFPLHNDEVAVNLNKNLYIEHDGMIFSEGAKLEDEKYIHLKIRDLRIELSLAEFKELSEAIIEAKGKLDE